MAKLNIFISYQRDSADFARALAADIEAHEHDVWFDEELVGGTPWWETILHNIRRCDVFMFIVDEKSLISVACTRELEYAIALNRQVVPIRHDDSVDIELWPPDLGERELIDFTLQDRVVYRQLTVSLNAVKESPALPDDLPEPPDLPVTPIGAIAKRPKDPTRIDKRDQLYIFHQLKHATGAREADVVELNVDIAESLDARNEAVAEFRQ